MRIVLGTGVFAIGVELPMAYMLQHWKSLAIMVIPTMTFGWFVSAGQMLARMELFHDTH
jgi:NhaP-type Na+/H+ or K+/H+ antiporter